MRSFGVGILAFVGLLLVPLADAGLWTHRQLLASDAFTDLSVDVLHQPEVADALAERLTTEVDARADVPSDARAIVESAIRSVIATPEFEHVFRTAVGGMHEQLERGDDRLTLDFDRALPDIKRAVARFDPDVAGQIPDTGLPVITVVREREVPELWQTVHVVRRAALLVPIAALVVLALAVLISWRRGPLLIGIGVGMVAIAVALALLIELGRELLSDVAGTPVHREAFAAGYDTVTASFVAQTGLLAVIGIIVGVAGATLLWRQRRNRRPISWA